MNNSGNPLLEPVHGIDLHTYTAMTIKVAAGVDQNEICKAMGIEPAIWAEVNTIWGQRMAEDTSFTITMLFGQYFAEPAKHPKLEALGSASSSPEGEANLERLRSDVYFYNELEAARQAAYDYGLDGAQWILDNFEVSLGDFQTAASHWMQQRNTEDWSDEAIMEFESYREEMYKKYADDFAAEQGGNVADDVDF